MALATFVCAGCRTRSRGPRHTSPTGRVLCESCHTSLLGVAVAQASGQSLGETIATVGWLQRIRAARGKRPWPGEWRPGSGVVAAPGRPGLTRVAP